MDKVGIYAVPFIIFAILVYGAVKKTDLFGCFCSGAKEGISSLISIAPTLMSASGFFDIMTTVLSPVCNAVGIPSEILPLGLIRPISGSGSFAVLSSILEQHGADNKIGMIASVMAGSTETTFYAIAVYYGAAGLKKTGCTVPAALAADFCSMIFAVLTVSCL